MRCLLYLFCLFAFPLLSSAEGVQVVDSKSPDLEVSTSTGISLFSYKGKPFTGQVVDYYAKHPRDPSPEKKKRQVAHIENGVMQKLNFYHDDQTPWSNLTCKDGYIHGSHTIWHSPEVKGLEGNYKDGRRDGVWIERSRNGTMTLKVLYKDGVVNGPYSSWHGNKKVSHKGSFSNGNGRVEQWDAFGYKQSETVFSDNGRSYKQIEYAPVSGLKSAETYAENSSSTLANDGLNPCPWSTTTVRKISNVPKMCDGCTLIVRWYGKPNHEKKMSETRKENGQITVKNWNYEGEITKDEVYDIDDSMQE